MQNAVPDCENSVNTERSFTSADILSRLGYSCQKNSLNFFVQHARDAPILAMTTFAEFKHPNITLFSLSSERSRLKHVSPPGESRPVSIQWKEVSAWRLVIRVAAQMLLYRSLFLGYFLHMNNILRAQKS